MSKDCKCNSVGADIAVIVAFVILIILFVGEPDLMDSIINLIDQSNSK